MIVMRICLLDLEMNMFILNHKHYLVAKGVCIIHGFGSNLRILRLNQWMILKKVMPKKTR